MAITDLSVIDRLSTRARREGSSLFLEVLDGVNVLASEEYTNASTTTITEIPGLLSNLLASVIRGGGNGGSGLNAAQIAAGATAVIGQLPTGETVDSTGTINSTLHITGNFTYGSTLTANVGKGWQVGGYQWLSDGAAIDGATNSTYVLGVADIGKVISVRATNAYYVAPDSAVVLYTGPSLYRFATALNKLASNSISPSSGNLTVAGRMFRPIGSSHKKSLAVVLNNWAMFQSANVQNGINVTLQEMYLETNGIAKRLTWNGLGAFALVDGQVDLRSDNVLPSDFNLARFERNRIMYLKYKYTCPIGGRFPITEASEGETVSRYWLNDEATVSNLDGAGALVFTGTSTITTEISAVIVGEDEVITTDGRAWLAMGDSIVAQGGPSSYFQTALRGNGTNYIAGCACAKVGGTYTMFINNASYFTPLYKYANGTIDETHTNSIASLSAASLLTASRSIWAQARANKTAHPLARDMHVMRVPLLVKTTDSGGGTVADAGWDAGGKVEVLNDSYVAEIGQPTGINSYAANLMDSPNLQRRGAGTKGVAGSDYYKWPSGRTGDGLHPNSVAASGTTGLGANLRVYLEANA